MTTGQAWPWPDTMDALAAAPASHRVLLDNDRVRVLEVVFEPGTGEPEHTHQAASVMIVDEQAPIRYYANGETHTARINRRSSDSRRASEVPGMPGGSSITGQMIQRGVTPAPAPASPRHPSADPGGGPAHPGRGRDDGIRPGDLLPVEAEHLPGGDLRPARLLRA
jgi:hypothetical protein